MTNLITRRPLEIFTTGGTIDKIYFDALSTYQIGDSAIDTIFREAGARLPYKLTALMKKDSLDLTPDDRARIRGAVAASERRAVLITHGTDTMVETAQLLANIEGKTIVLTGAMQPAALRSSDAVFNIGFAVSATQTLPHGCYIAMNAQIFDPQNVRKDRAAQQFKEAQK